MFGFFSKKNVPQLLNEGRTWVSNLEEASAVTTAKAEDLSEQANALNMEAATLQFIADEGQAVADNFKKILYLTPAE